MSRFIRSSFVIALALVLLGGSAAVADAHSDKPQKAAKIQARATIPLKMRLQIAATGRAQLEGQVQTVGTNSFTITTWGGSVIINTASSTKFNHKGGLSTIRVGDTVKIQGKVTSTNPLTIMATHIDNKTNKKPDNSGTGSTTPPTLGLGVVSSVNTASSTLVLTLNNSTSTINILTSSTTVFLNKVLSPITFGQIQTGHSLAISGTTTATSTIQASVVQDLSI